MTDASRYLCFYGSLRCGADAMKLLGIDQQMRWVGPCQIKGALYDLGEYPALVEGEDVIEADLFEMPDATTLAIIDDWEDYFAANEADSIYLRRETQLLKPDLRAETYWYNRHLDDAARVDGGCWLRWRGWVQ